MKRKDNTAFTLGIMLFICLALVTCTVGRITDDPYQIQPTQNEAQ
ncbi:hypothetical protein [Arthronema virus TR020]|uniref:Uncharacterized protein n=1 Tax=Arthronema virus TR020 TaxID=2736280 RepID=A0A7G3WH23_9CAUD|nr:hypothetical protein [Arthronema virus TR020]